MSTSTRIHIMLPDATLEKVDEIRGLVPRSAYIRHLIESALDIEIDFLSLRDEPKPKRDYSDDPTMLGTKTRRIRVEPIKKDVPVGQNQTVVDHHHVWERAGNIFDRCTKCGETRRH